MTTAVLQTVGPAVGLGVREAQPMIYSFGFGFGDNLGFVFLSASDFELLVDSA